MSQSALELPETFLSVQQEGAPVFIKAARKKRGPYLKMWEPTNSKPIEYPPGVMILKLSEDEWKVLNLSSRKRSKKIKESA